MLLLSAVPYAARAQMVPDNDRIFAQTMDGNSPFSYTALMMRYRAGDTTLTVEDYHYLYYGYAFRDEYDPLVPIPAESKMFTVFERGEDPGYSGMLEIIGYGKEVFERDPFSPSNLNFLTFAYGAIGDSINERINYDRFVKVLEVIEASGNGLKEQTPMHVLRSEHALDLLASKGLTPGKRMIVSRTVEFIGLQEKDGKNKGYYFDYGRMYWKKPSMEPENKRTWQFNNLPPKEKK